MKHLVIFGYVKDKTYICKILNAFITSIYLLLKILTTEKNMKKNNGSIDGGIGLRFFRSS